MTAYFNRFTLNMTLAEARDASHQGKCDDDVAYLVAQSKIRRQLDKITPDDIRAELKEYGAWDATELADDSANRNRITWIAAGHIQEENAGKH